MRKAAGKRLPHGATSALVVDAMRSAESARGAAVERSTLAYVNELKGLIPFYKDQFTALEEKVRGWDAEIRRALLDAGTLDAEIKAQEAELRLKKSSGYNRLDDAALRAVKTWGFRAGTRNGVAEAMWFDVPVLFRLDE